MDADLSHPIEKIQELITPIITLETNFVLGSRYIESYYVKDWPFFRQLTSRVATILAKPIIPSVSDPLSGFFAIRRFFFNTIFFFNIYIY